MSEWRCIRCDATSCDERQIYDGRYHEYGLQDLCCPCIRIIDSVMESERQRQAVEGSDGSGPPLRAPCA